jgi:hypothetical protein
MGGRGYGGGVPRLKSCSALQFKQLQIMACHASASSGEQSSIRVCAGDRSLQRTELLEGEPNARPSAPARANPRPPFPRQTLHLASRGSVLMEKRRRFESHRKTMSGLGCGIAVLCDCVAISIFIRSADWKSRACFTVDYLRFAPSNTSITSGVLAGAQAGAGWANTSFPVHGTVHPQEQSYLS